LSPKLFLLEIEFPYLEYKNEINVVSDIVRPKFKIKLPRGISIGLVKLKSINQRQYLNLNLAFRCFN